MYPEGGTTSYCGQKKTSIHNWCNTTPALSADGNAIGDTIFVYRLCDGTKGIDWNNPNQDAIYRFPGVSTAQDAPQPPTIDAPATPVETLVEDIDLTSLFPPVLGIFK